MGWRGRIGGRSGPWPGRGPFSYLPPWQRPGWIYGYGGGMGYGMGYGRGYGMGYGRGYGISYGRGFGYGSFGVPNNPYVCGRFPWLPRWWWARPNTYGYGAPYVTGYYGYGYPGMYNPSYVPGSYSAY
jgi:hypothetical protein